MDVIVHPRSLEGVIPLPSSKSITHRALICAALSCGTSRIDYPLDCEDTRATIHCLKAAGVEFEEVDQTLVVKSSGKLIVTGRLDAWDSATTLRLLIPVLMHFQSNLRFHASERLIERIQTSDLSTLKGLRFKFGKTFVDVEGKLEDHLELSESLTTQWISGVLLTLPMQQKTLIVRDAKSDYIRLTTSMMQEFGVEVSYQDNCFLTRNYYLESDVEIEGDCSNASFYLNMASFNPITVTRMNENSLQGDRVYPFFLDQIKRTQDSVELSLEWYPDLAIPLACFASVSGKHVKLTNLGKLALKESNRMESVYEVLVKLGASIAILEDSLIIEGQDLLEGGVTIDSYMDHRIVMGVVSIASRLKNSITITRAEAVRKSYPDFFEVIEGLGGRHEF